MDQLTFNGSTLKIDAQNGAATTYWSCQRAGHELALINQRPENLFEGSLLFPFPNRIEAGKYSFHGTDYQLELNDLGLPNSLHGFIYNKAFRLISRTENSVQYEYEFYGELKAYPFPFNLNITYSLGENELTIKVEVKNTGNTAMPCGFGWHPYLNLDLNNEACKLKLPKVSNIEVGKNLIPTGAESEFKTFQELSSVQGILLDNCFVLDTILEKNSCFLHYPKLGSLEIWQDPNFSFIQVYKPNEKTMAIEPMTCGVNAFNTKQGLKELGPQETWALSMGLRFL